MSVVADNDRYRLTDWTYEGLTVSKTELKAGQSTRGHKHPNPEIYYFLDDALIELDGNQRPVKAGEFVFVRPDIFHRVSTPPNQVVTFLSFFAAPRSGEYGSLS